MTAVAPTIPSADVLQNALDRAVIGLFQKKASTFLTTIYCSLRFSWDTSIPTACTNGVRLQINPVWFTTLSEPMRITLLAHEIWHVAYMHMARVMSRNFRTWNEACDHAINLMLKEHGYKFDINPMTGREMGLHDSRFTDMSADQIYEILDREKQAGKPENPDFVEDFEAATTPEEAVQVEAKITQTLIRAATLSRMNADEAGDIPGDVVLAIEKLLNPQLPWHQIMSGFFNELSEQTRSWSRPNRRYQDMYLPSNGGVEGLDHIMWSIDASISMSDHHLTVINTEIAAVKRMFNPKKMTIVVFDTEIRDVWEVTDADEFSRLTIKGRGGTDLHELMEFAQKTAPDALVVFTDMEFTVPPKPGKVPVLWICLDNPGYTAPYGRMIHLDSSTFGQA